MEEVLSNEGSELSGPSAIERMLAAGGASVIAGGAAAVWYFDPAKAGFFPVCPLYVMTGFACPGCGLTRGFHALFHGDILAALEFNALLPLFVVLVGFGFFSLASFAIRGTRSTIRLIHPNALWVFLVLLIVFGAVRNLPWYPFTVLFP
jgi:hypothetical protein